MHIVRPNPSAVERRIEKLILVPSRTALRRCGCGSRFHLTSGVHPDGSTRPSSSFCRIWRLCGCSRAPKKSKGPPTGGPFDFFLLTSHISLEPDTDLDGEVLSPFAVARKVI